MPKIRKGRSAILLVAPLLGVLIAGTSMHRFIITIENPEPYNRVADVSLWGNGVSNKAYPLLRCRP